MKPEQPVLGRDLKTEYEVLMTYAYNIFSHLGGNRNLNPHHIVRLKNAMSKRTLFSPIICNEKYEIIDGQHRFEALRSLSKPIYYIVLKGYGLEEVQILNTHSTNWKKTDYLQGYCDLGIKPYVDFRKFMNDFPKFGFQSSSRILCTSGSKKESGVMVIKAFESGKLHIPDIAKAYDVARKIYQIDEYYANFHRTTFVAAMIQMLKKSNFKFKEFMDKIDVAPAGTLKDCGTVTAYIEKIEYIYNYKRVNKVNLRF